MLRAILEWTAQQPGRSSGGGQPGERLVGQVPVSHRPVLDLGFEDDLFRYNRVEALSVGGRLSFPISALTDLSFTGRIGVGDWQPRGEVRLERELWIAVLEAQLVAELMRHHRQEIHSAGDRSLGS